LFNLKSIEPNTENVVKCHSNVVKPGRKVLFTPNTNSDGVYWSHCLSTIDENGDVKLKVINLNDFNLEFNIKMAIFFIKKVRE
jgi:hypothetical protein